MFIVFDSDLGGKYIIQPSYIKGGTWLKVVLTYIIFTTKYMYKEVTHVNI